MRDRPLRRRLPFGLLAGTLAGALICGCSGPATNAAPPATQASAESGAPTPETTRTAPEPATAATRIPSAAMPDLKALKAAMGQPFDSHPDAVENLPQIRYYTLPG